MEVDKTSIAYKLSQIKTLAEFEEFEKNTPLLPVQEEGVALKGLALQPETIWLRKDGLKYRPIADVTRHPPYPKDKLEQMLTTVPFFLDSEVEDIKQPVINPEWIEKAKSLDEE